MRRPLTILIMILLLTLSSGSCFGQPVHLYVGDSKVEQFTGLKRIAVGDPKICDYRVLDSETVLINGITPGRTNLLVWTEKGLQDVVVEVEPKRPDLNRLESELQMKEVHLNWVGNTLVARGNVEDEEDREYIEEALTHQWPAVVTLLKSPPPQEEPSPPSLESILAETEIEGVRLKQLGNVVILTGEVSPEERDLIERVVPITSERVVNLVCVKQEEPVLATAETAPPPPTPVLPPTAEEVEQLLDMPGVRVRAVGDYFVLEGQVPSQAVAAGVVELAEQWCPSVSFLDVVSPAPVPEPKILAETPASEQVQDVRRVLLQPDFDAETLSRFKSLAIPWGPAGENPQLDHEGETPEPDLLSAAGDLEENLRSVLKADSVEVQIVHGAIVVCGEVESKRQENLVLDLAGLYSLPVINGLRIRQGKEVKSLTLEPELEPEWNRPLSAPQEEIPPAHLEKLAGMIGVPGLSVETVGKTIIIDGTGTAKDIERALKLAAVFAEDVVNVAVETASEQNIEKGPAAQESPALESPQAAANPPLNAGPPLSFPAILPAMEEATLATKEVAPAGEEVPPVTEEVAPAKEVVHIRVQVVEMDEEAGRILEARLQAKPDENGVLIALGSEELYLALNSLISSGKGRTLSRPTLVSLDGEEAVLLAGGEIPVPAGSGPDAGIEWREYGVKLSTLPEVRDEDIILTLETEVSGLDWANGVSYGDSTIPAVKTRRIKTKVRVKLGETLFLGGLLMTNEHQKTSKVPVLGDLPIFGRLFRQRALVQKSTDLAIFLTPTLDRTEKEVDHAR